ncbi:MAG: hypothetical protein K8H89_00105 [Flavobacteriales bacterium]|jgi:uncharacterized integral membrane protein|nr:hypothetical protein [Flavobacteriales bacterium]
MEHLPITPPEGQRLAARTTILCCAVVLLCYSVVRAITVSFTWDESWSFLHYVIPRVYFQNAFDAMGANHHMLNVWGMIAASHLFGNSELSLRLPNLLAHAVFLYATARIALRSPYYIVSITAFLVLNLDPYLLDFFSLARGYGLAIGWMMLSLWMFTRYFTEGRQLKWLALAMLTAALSALSNLIMINYLLALATAFAALWGMDTLRGQGTSKRHLGVVAAGTALGLAATLPSAIALSQGGSLFFGCGSIWDCALNSLAEKLMYLVHYGWPARSILLVFFAFAVVCVTAVVFSAWRGRWMKELQVMLFGACVTGACIAFNMLQHVLFDTPFPKDRTALYLVPLILFVPVSGLVAWPRGSFTPGALGTVLALPLLLHMARSANLTHCVEWKPEGEVSKMLALISHDHLPLGKDRPVVSLSTSFESWGCLPYYQVRDNMQWLMATPREYPKPFATADYYIVESDGQDQVDPLNWELLYHSAATGTDLYRDKRMRALHRKAERIVLDMEAPDVIGRSNEQHVSGRFSVRFDAATRSTNRIYWVVPDTIPAGMVLIYGTGSTLQPEANNWIALVLRVARGQQELAMSNMGPTLEARYPGQWAKLAVSLVPMVDLLPGDTVQMSAWPMFDLNVMYLDDMVLSVIH